jgi:hypothetical protein
MVSLNVRAEVNYRYRYTLASSSASVAEIFFSSFSHLLLLPQGEDGIFEREGSGEAHPSLSLRIRSRDLL